MIPVYAAVLIPTLAAAVIGVLGWHVHRAARLERLLDEHNRGEAGLKALAEPPPLSEPHAGRLLRMVCAHCPDCGCEMQDEGWNFWCPYCQAAVSHARVASEGN